LQNSSDKELFTPKPQFYGISETLPVCAFQPRLVGPEQIWALHLNSQRPRVFLIRWLFCVRLTVFNLFLCSHPWLQVLSELRNFAVFRLLLQRWLVRYWTSYLSDW